MTPQPCLLDRVRDAARRLHYSLRTEDAYVLWIRRFILGHADFSTRMIYTHVLNAGPLDVRSPADRL